APPAPVNDYPYRPSTLTAVTEGPDSTKAANNRWTLVSDARSRSTTPVTAPRQLAPAKVPTRGLGGGPLAAVMLAPMLVDGGLRIFTYSAEARALGIEDME